MKIIIVSKASPITIKWESLIFSHHAVAVYKNLYLNINVNPDDLQMASLCVHHVCSVNVKSVKINKQTKKTIRELFS